MIFTILRYLHSLCVCKSCTSWYLQFYDILSGTYELEIRILRCYDNSEKSSELKTCDIFQLFLNN
jgi:hypothetical protein